MIDASDHNPSLLGQGSSEISRIRIISEDQYAEYIRAKTTIDQFASRFEAARDAMDDARDALEKLREAAGKGDPEAIGKAAEEAAKAHEKAAELLDRIAGDFPAFELEKRLQDLAEKQAEDLRENIDALENFDPKAPKADQQAAIDEMLKRLAAPRAAGRTTRPGRGQSQPGRHPDGNGREIPPDLRSRRPRSPNASAPSSRNSATARTRTAACCHRSAKTRRKTARPSTISKPNSAAAPKPCPTTIPT